MNRPEHAALTIENQIVGNNSRSDAVLRVLAREARKLRDDRECICLWWSENGISRGLAAGKVKAIEQAILGGVEADWLQLRTGAKEAPFNEPVRRILRSHEPKPPSLTGTASTAYTNVFGVTAFPAMRSE